MALFKRKRALLTQAFQQLISAKSNLRCAQLVQYTLNFFKKVENIAVSIRFIRQKLTV